MKLGVVAVFLALGGLPSTRAKLGRQPKSKTSTPQSEDHVKLGSMAANLQNAATESFLRTRLAADEKEIQRQKERGDSQEKLVDILASRLDLEERRMAKFIIRVADLEKKANITAAAPAKGQKMPAQAPAKVPQVTMKLSHAEVPATAAKALEAKHTASSTKSTPQQAAKAVADKASSQQLAKSVSQGSPKLPTVVKLAHSEIPATAAKALESKHVPSPAKQVAQPSNSSASKSSDVEEDRIPEADTLTAVDTQGLDEDAKSDEVELSNEDNDEVDTALENEELGENDATQKNTVAKTAVVHLAHRTVPASSSSEDQAPVAKASPPVTPPVETASAKKVISVPPPPPPQPPVAKISAPPVPPAQVVAVPPPPKVSPSTDSIPPPPPAIADIAKDVDMSTADEAADTTDSADSNVEDASTEDELEKDDEAASLADEPETKPALAAAPSQVSTSSDTSSEVSGDSDNSDMDVANEEKELDTEEAAVADEGPGSASTGSELDDEQV